MKKIIVITFILAVLSGYSQTNNKQADDLFNKMSYVDAAKAYESAINKGDTSKETLQRAGDSYYFNTHMREANKWYAKLVSEYPDTVSPEYIFRYAQTLQGIEDYTLAKKWIKIFTEKSAISDNRFGKLSQNKQKLDDLLRQSPQFTLQNLSINSKNSDFGPMYYKDQLVYATTIDTSNYKTSIYQWNNQPFLRLQLGRINPLETDVTSSKRFSKTLNTKYHEAGIAFSPDQNTIYFTRNNYDKRLIRDGKGINNLKLYSAKAENQNDGTTEWKDIRELPFNSDNYSVGHPTVSKDGTKLYFVSDMPGSIGATDIFVVDILRNNQYSQPKNLGETINTTGREMFPFITETSLYFASDGHLGLGGLDVFESKYDSNTFSTPVNLGAPLNSSYDDFAYIVNEQTNKGYVCSNRKSGKGDDDIYSFERMRCDQSIRGTITNIKTNEKIANVNVVLYDGSNNKLEETKTDSNGAYKFNSAINCGENYTVEAKKSGYKTGTKAILIPTNSGETVLPLPLETLNNLIVEENGILKIKIGIIFFDLDKSNIRNDAAIELNKVVLLMNEYKDMVIKIESHTDSRGNDEYNLKLSDRRAKASRDYIIANGIAPERIQSAIGYGETQLVNNCKNGVPCTEAEHQMNRRSEFMILKM